MFCNHIDDAVDDGGSGFNGEYHCSTWIAHVLSIEYMPSCRNLTWWRHQIEIFSALLVLCTGNSPVTGEFPAQRPVTRGFDVFFDLHLKKRLSQQSWDWWFETPSRSLWRHSNDTKWLRENITNVRRRRRATPYFFSTSCYLIRMT